MTISILSWLPLVTSERYGTMVSLSRINVDFHFFFEQLDDMFVIQIAVIHPSLVQPMQ